MKILKKIFSTKNERELSLLVPLAKKVNEWEERIKTLNDNELLEKSLQLKQRCQGGEKQEKLLPEAFALVRETALRTLKMRHFDVQIIGGIVLYQGKIAEMKTGEGKTLVATLAAYLRALEGKGVHLITVNDHLAKRDAQWMSPLYEKLGLSIGCITAQTTLRDRKEAYACDITYGTNNEFGFDYLRDNMVNSFEEKVQRGHHFAIVDEVDSILIDEARTPLIISGPSESNTKQYFEINKIIPQLTEGKLDEKGKEIENSGDFTIDKKENRLTITEKGTKTIEKILDIDNLYSPQNTNLLHHITQALKAHKLYQRDVHYLVEDRSIHIIDEFTGRKMHGRRFSNGLHQAIEAKENVEILSENQTVATTTLQNYFRLYTHLAGMTGTADTEAQEFKTIYDLDVIVIPTNRPIARIDREDHIYLKEIDKFNAILKLVKEKHQQGNPILIGTASVEKSEELSRLLKKNHLPHELLNAKQHEREAQIIKNAGEYGHITIATNMAGRGTDIKINDRVKSLGGLVVIGSERHESRRIDNQLRGRCGRQGDPGETIFFLSLDDGLLRRFYSEKMSSILSKIGLPDGEEIKHPWITRQIEMAQKKIEMGNFEIRKYLLEYDDVINFQRNYIYSLRDRILKEEEITTEIHFFIDEMLKNQLLGYSPQKNLRISPDLMEKNLDWLEKDFVLDEVKEHFAGEENAAMSTRDFIQQASQYLKQKYREKQQQHPKEIMTQVEKFIMLQVLDNHWKEHLHNIDQLREGISLRSYGERKPLVEFKNEGFALFESMIIHLQLETLQMLFAARLLEDDRAPEIQPSKNKNLQAQKKDFSLTNSLQPDLSSPSTTTVKNEKQGRNEPCFCGSGKKYKHCHLKK